MILGNRGEFEPGFGFDNLGGVALRSLVEDVSSVAGSNAWTVLRKERLDLTVVAVNSVRRSCLATGL